MHIELSTVDKYGHTNTCWKITFTGFAIDGPEHNSANVILCLYKDIDFHETTRGQNNQTDAVNTTMRFTRAEFDAANAGGNIQQMLYQKIMAEELDEEGNNQNVYQANSGVIDFSKGVLRA